MDENKKKLTKEEKKERVRLRKECVRKQAKLDEKNRLAAHEARLQRAGTGAALAKQRGKDNHAARMAYHQYLREGREKSWIKKEAEILDNFRKKNNFPADAKMHVDRKTGNIVVESATFGMKGPNNEIKINVPEGGDGVNRVAGPEPQAVSPGGENTAF